MCRATLHKRILLISLPFSVIALHNFGNVSVCKGLENIGRRKNIDFFFEWKDEVQ